MSASLSVPASPRLESAIRPSSSSSSNVFVLCKWDAVVVLLRVCKWNGIRIKERPNALKSVHLIIQLQNKNSWILNGHLLLTDTRKECPRLVLLDRLKTTSSSSVTIYVGTMLRTKVPLSVLSNSQQLNGRSTTSIPVLPVLCCCCCCWLVSSYIVTKFRRSTRAIGNTTTAPSIFRFDTL